MKTPARHVTDILSSWLIGFWHTISLFIVAVCGGFPKIVANIAWREDAMKKKKLSYVQILVWLACVVCSSSSLSMSHWISQFYTTRRRRINDKHKYMLSSKNYFPRARFVSCTYSLSSFKLLLDVVIVQFHLQYSHQRLISWRFVKKSHMFKADDSSARREK